MIDLKGGAPPFAGSSFKARLLALLLSQVGLQGLNVDGPGRLVDNYVILKFFHLDLEELQRGKLRLAIFAEVFRVKLNSIYCYFWHHVPRQSSENRSLKSSPVFPFTNSDFNSDT